MGRFLIREDLGACFFLTASKPGMPYTGALRLKVHVYSALDEKTNFRGS